MFFVVSAVRIANCYVRPCLKSVSRKASVGRVSGNFSVVFYSGVGSPATPQTSLHFLKLHPAVPPVPRPHTEWRCVSPRTTHTPP